MIASTGAVGPRQLSTVHELLTAVISQYAVPHRWSCPGAVCPVDLHREMWELPDFFSSICRYEEVDQ